MPADIRRCRSTEHESLPRKCTGELSDFGLPLSLICGACGRRGRYEVGAVIILPEYFEKRRAAAESMPLFAEDAESMPTDAADDESMARDDADGESMPPPDALDQHVGFTRYFRCKRCDAGGPWRLPGFTRMQVLMSAAADAMLGRDSGGVHIARPITFDGQLALLPTQAEAIIREHLSREPDSSHLWTRLGNVYKAGRRPDLARPAYEKALELDPANIDAHMMLAQALEERHATRLALKHWLAVLKHARNATGTPREERLSMVSAALDGALTLARDPNKAFKSLLEHDDKGDAAASDEPLVLHVQELDLGDPDDWNAICCTFLGEPLAPAHRRPRRRLRSPQTARFEPPPVEPAAWRDDDAPATVFDDHPPRNAPCPCGSGKKYKKCCGAARQAPATAGRALKEWVS